MNLKKHFSISLIVIALVLLISSSIVNAACINMRTYTNDPGLFDSDSRKKEEGCSSDCYCPKRLIIR